jgi:hypothetical protein
MVRQCSLAPGQVWVALTDREPELTSRAIEKDEVGLGSIFRSKRSNQSWLK